MYNCTRTERAELILEETVRKIADEEDAGMLICFLGSPAHAHYPIYLDINMNVSYSGFYRLRRNVVQKVYWVFKFGFWWIEKVDIGLSHSMANGVPRGFEASNGSTLSE